MKDITTDDSGILAQEEASPVSATEIWPDTKPPVYKDLLSEDSFCHPSMEDDEYLFEMFLNDRMEDSVKRSIENQTGFDDLPHNAKGHAI